MEENPGQYVKLKKENITKQPATEEGELNQPVEVPVVRPAAPSRDPQRILCETATATRREETRKRRS